MNTDSTGEYVEPGYVDPGYFGTAWYGKVLISGQTATSESGSDTFRSTNITPAPPPQPSMGGGGEAPAKTSRYSDSSAYEPDRVRERLTVKVGNREYDVFDPTLLERIEELAAEPEPEAPTELERQDRKLARTFTVQSPTKTVEVPMFRPMLAELPDLKTAMMEDIEAFAAKAREAANDERRRIVLLLMACE